MRIIEKFNKKIKGIKIEETDLYQYIMDHQSLLEEYNIPLNLKYDFDYFNYEIIINGLKTRKFIEDKFSLFRYEDGDMYNYLNYGEIRQLFNQALHPELNAYPYFNYEQSRIYMPFYNKMINDWYYDDYQITLLKAHSDMLKELTVDSTTSFQYYGYKIYDSAFSSLQLCYEDNAGVVYYSHSFEKLYLFKKETHTLIYELSLRDVRSEGVLSKEKVETIVSSILHNDISQMLDEMYQYHLILEKTYLKFKKKIEKKG